MSITTVAELKAALGVGSLYSDAVIQSVCDAADDVLLPFIWANTTPLVAHSNTATTGTSYFDERVDDVFYVGQAVVISGAGSKHNGNKTITEVGAYEITYAITGNNNTATVRHPVNPYGMVKAETYLDPSTVSAIQEASLMVCVSIWTARQTNSGNGMNPDGSIGSMYSMSSQLIARVRGLLSPYLDPRSLIG
jgi:hypothetical protein